MAWCKKTLILFLQGELQAIPVNPSAVVVFGLMPFGRS